jgi:hypothetical protein
MADFVHIIKSFIAENKLRDLSSEGWGRMRQVQREIDNKKISKDDALQRFLGERDFRIDLDRHKVEDLKKKLR